MSFHQCTEMFVQLNVLCLGNWLHAPLRKKCGEVLVFSIFHPTRLFRPTQLLIWMNLPPYTIIPHCTAIWHFTVDYIAINAYAYDNILNCEMLHHEDSNNSDHLGVSCQLNMECQLTEGDVHSTRRTHCRLKWENDDFRRAYLQSLQSTLAKLPVTNPDEVEPEIAQAVINSQCSILGNALPMLDCLVM